MKKDQKKPKKKSLLLLLGVLIGFACLLLMIFLYHLQDQIKGPPLPKGVSLDQPVDNIWDQQEDLINQLQADPSLIDYYSYAFLPSQPIAYTVSDWGLQWPIDLALQTDANWRYLAYGSDGSQTIGENGCAILALAMIRNYYEPADLASLVKDLTKWAGNHYYSSGQGTRWAIFTDFAEHYGYQITDYGANLESALETLHQGHLLLVSVGPGHFTQAGHMMVIRGYEEGYVYLNDPNDNLEKLWSYQPIPIQWLVDEGINYWSLIKD